MELDQTSRRTKRKKLVKSKYIVTSSSNSDLDKQLETS